MGVTAAIIGAAATTASVVVSHQQSKKARAEAERQAALERQALSELRAEREPTIPTADDEAVRRSRRRSIVSQLARRGRSSTILTSQAGGDALGT